MKWFLKYIIIKNEKIINIMFINKHGVEKWKEQMYKRIVKEGYQGVFGNRFRLLMLVVILMIALLFGLLSVSAYWNPADKMKSLPVAFVNLDQGVMTEKGYVCIGDEIADAVAKSSKVDFEVTKKDIFADGIENTDYYFGFMIPADFSKTVLAGATGKPKQATIEYYSDQRKNFLLTQMSSSVRLSVEKSIQQAVSTRYGEALEQGLYDVQPAIEKAADGAGQLADGLALASNGSGTLYQGLTKAGKAAKTLTSGLNTLSASSNSLAEGTTNLYKGITILKQKTEEATTGVDQLVQGSEALLQGLTTTKTSILAGFDAYSGEASKKTSALESFFLAFSSDSNGSVTLTNEEYQQVMALVNDIKMQQEVGTSGLKSGISGGFDQLIGDKNKGATKLSYALGNLQQGMTLMGDTMTTFENGCASLSKGSTALASGLNQGATGSGSLESGMTSLESGSEKLRDALDTAETGANNLQNGLSQGESLLSEKLVNSPSAMGEYVGNPIATEENIYGDVTTYGMSFLPLFLSIGSWIGCLLLFFAVPLPPNEKIGSKKRWMLVSGHYTVMAGFAMLLAGLLSLGTIWFFHIDAHRIVAFVLFEMVVSLTLMAFLYSLQELFGPGGKALAIILVSFQIAASGGTFPAVLLPGFFKGLHPWLPMTYTVDGFREVLFGNMIVWSQSGMLAIYGVIGLLLAVFFGGRAQRLNKDMKLSF